jgi:colicin import membrane protein
MKRLLLCCFALATAFSAAAQPADGTAAERARIGAERAAADARLKEEEAACYKKFAVNDCVNEAKARRRAVTADLRRQELMLNDAERKRRGSERIRAIEERSTGERERQEKAAADHARAIEDHEKRQAEVARKAASRPAADAERGQRAVQRQGQAREKAAATQQTRAERVGREAEERARYEQRLKEAQERKARITQRLETNRKPDVKPLPSPVAP